MAESFVHLKASGSSEEPSPAGSKSDAETGTAQQRDEHKGRIHNGETARNGSLRDLRDVSARPASCHPVLHDIDGVASARSLAGGAVLLSIMNEWLEGPSMF
jgi:hypothetical protein